MKRALIILVSVIFTASLHSQNIKEFKADTASYVAELVSFTGTALQSTEVPDFERFIHLFDSLPYERQMEIIEVSNLMLNRKCRPRPHFIKYQRIIMEFFYEDKTSHGYSEWLEGYKIFLESDAALTRTVDQWLSLSLSLLEDNIFYASNSITWKVSTPSFQFQTDETMTVRFEDVTVACYSGSYFIQIMEATGFIDPLSLQWHGTRGRVTWEHVGIPDTEMYAILGDFRINLKTPTYVADSAILHYPTVFEGEVLGRLEDKVTLVKNLQQTKYPQFVSYQNYYRIEEFAPGIIYQGGISIEGANLVGSGTKGSPAVMEIFSNDTLRIRTESYRISMNGRFIRSPQTTVSIYFGTDSVFHPDLQLA
ncbi:MAG: hypothetical protein KAT15_04330, partial [Bacteroidales bacterium]|nr:hypothetical protein [Bacteroidales bacterium]